MPNKLKPYFVKEKGTQWSVLSFHYTAHDAKVNAARQWLCRFEYIDLRVRKADSDYMIFNMHDFPHVIESWSGRVPHTGEHPSWSDALTAIKKHKQNGN